MGESISSSFPQQTLRWLRALPPERLCILVFLLVFSFRLFLTLAVTRDFVSEECEVDLIARSLATDGVFGNGYRGPTGPTSHAAPGYPFLLSIIYSIIGMGVTAEVVKQVLCTAVVAASYALLPMFSSYAGTGTLPGLAAGLIGLLPLKLNLETKCGDGEPLYALILIGISLITLQAWSNQKLNLSHAVIQGLIWGVALLFAPPFLVILFGFAIVEFFLVFNRERKRYVQGLVVRFIIIATLLMPWTIRNYQQFGTLVFIRGNLGLELASANNETSALDLFSNNETRVTKQIHPNLSDEAVAQVRRIGEPAYFHQMRNRALEWMSSHPTETARRSVLRFLLFWFPIPLREIGPKPIVRSAIACILTLAAFIGFFRLWRRGYRAAPMITAIWVMFPIVYYFVVHDPRYRYPIEWTINFCASYLLIEALSRLPFGAVAGSHGVAREADPKGMTPVDG